MCACVSVWVCVFESVSLYKCVCVGVYLFVGLSRLEFLCVCECKRVSVSMCVSLCPRLCVCVLVGGDKDYRQAH